jgi:uncharacterized repeat protein (TIGR01451 family)
MAAGVPAGTVIQNTATATYSTAAGPETVNSNTVIVKVGELLNVAVATQDSSPVAIGRQTAVLSYSVTNEGNGSEVFLLTANPAVTGNGFDATVQTVAIDSNGNNTYDPGVDTVIANGAASPVLAADSAIRVFVIVTAPSGAADAATSQVRLTAASVTGTGTPGRVIAGQGDGGVDAVVGATTAQADAQGALIARMAGITLTKSAAFLDSFGGSQPLPGAQVTYTLVAHVAGSGSLVGVRVTDAIPAGTTYLPGTLKLDGSSLSDAGDSDAGTAGSSGIDVALGNLSAGSPDKTITFAVKIN